MLESDMALRLRDNLYWCNCGGQVVFLDVEADRYFALGGIAGQAFLSVAEGSAPADSEALLASLISRGLLVDDADGRGVRPSQTIQAATGDLLWEPHNTAQLTDIVAAFASELRAALLLWRRPMREVLDSLAREPAGTPRSVRNLDELVQRIASASIMVSFVLRATDRCLVRALAVQSRCRRLGIKSKLVFGVRMRPFGAHCWVQFQEYVLVGDFEQVRLYTPILVLG